jgi:hypothetical protein
MDMEKEGKIEDENKLEQVKINQADQEIIEIYVYGKYLDVELEVKRKGINLPDNNGERYFDVYLSFHDDNGNESQILLTRDNKGCFSVPDCRYLKKK